MKHKLTRKQLVEHIRRIMPSDYNEYERLAFIECEVAKNISFDEKYLWGEMGTSEKIYKLAKKEAQNPQPKIKRKLICITMSELFGYVAKEFGFEVKYQRRINGEEIERGKENIFNNISEKEKEHVCTVIVLSNGQVIEVDIQYDLEKIQTRSRPKAFGLLKHENDEGAEEEIDILPLRLVKHIFKKVYGLKDEEPFTDEYIRTLAIQLRAQGKTFIEMLEDFMNDDRINKELINTRCIEANKIYKAILKVCQEMTIDENGVKGATIEECILSDAKGEKRYSFCLYAEDRKEKVFYIYSKKSRRMVKLTKEELKQLMQQVMNVELKGKPTEIKQQMMDFVNGNKENDANSKNEEPIISIEDIFWDDEEELEIE